MLILSIQKQQMETFMKSLLILLALSLSMGAMAAEFGSNNGVPYTAGSLGYTNQFYSLNNFG